MYRVRWPEWCSGRNRTLALSHSNRSEIFSDPRITVCPTQRNGSIWMIWSALQQGAGAMQRRSDLRGGFGCGRLRSGAACVARRDTVDCRHRCAKGGGPLRILVLGAGVIGSVYAGKLLQVGHEVVLLARGRRLSDLQTHGLILQEAESGDRMVLPVPSVSEAGSKDRYDLVLVSVRSEQLASTLALLTAMTDGSDVLFFGNTLGQQAELTAALGSRALFGFPAAGGVRDGPIIKYVLISQQKTMLGEPNGTTTSRARQLHAVLSEAGFSTRISPDIDSWLMGHTAFIVPIAFALYRVRIDAARLAADPTTMRLMVLATRQAFTALRAAGNAEIPTNLRVLYRLPTVLVVAYWQRVLASPRGELWFAAHTRAAPEEMRALADQLQAALTRAGRPTPHLDRLLATPV